MNPSLEGIAKIQEINWNEGTLRLKFTLDGLDKEIEAECKKIEIAADGSAITLGDFSASMPFIENALNRFATRTFKLPEGGATRIAIIAVKKALNI